MSDNEFESTNIENQDKTFGMLCHLLAFIGLLGVPFGHLLGPLVMWIIKKDESDFVDKCGKASINFQLSMTIYFLISIPLVYIIIGIPAILILYIIDIVCIIKASIKANEGILYQYPMAIKFF